MRTTSTTLCQNNGDFFCRRERSTAGYPSVKGSCDGSICWRHDTDEAHFWLNGYVNKQNCRIWSEAHPQVYVVTPLHPEKLTVWCSLWVGRIPSSKTMKATTLQSMVIGIEP
ncbi:hypothetical protein TNCV_255391 [Trichonephila clavipes]|nr:hypothetical protein TNCV_255391 [Trichonephila clavipes]